MPATLVPLADPYDRLAPAYGRLTAGYDYDRWLSALLELARGCGLRGRRVLDVACGTGSSSLPLLRRGYDVTGVDCSAAMLEEAAHRLGDAVPLVRADMRSLPRLGAFDLVACLDDAVNHLLSGAELGAAIDGMAANLAPGGLLLFDLNTLATLRSVFSSDWASEDEDSAVWWRGAGPSSLGSGQITSAEISILDRRAGGAVATEEVVVVRERHHPLDEVHDRLWRAGLEAVAVRGQHRGAVLDERADEAVHHKLVIVARRPAGLSAWTRAHGLEGGCC
jgi:SAM-dependent methyltransferase